MRAMWLQVFQLQKRHNYLFDIQIYAKKKVLMDDMDKYLSDRGDDTFPWSCICQRYRRRRVIEDRRNNLEITFMVADSASNHCREIADQWFCVWEFYSSRYISLENMDDDESVCKLYSWISLYLIYLETIF